MKTSQWILVIIFLIAIIAICLHWFTLVYGMVLGCILGALHSISMDNERNQNPRWKPKGIDC